jgi:hypothetical protein
VLPADGVLPLEASSDLRLELFCCYLDLEVALLLPLLPAVGLVDLEISQETHHGDLCRRRVADEDLLARGLHYVRVHLPQPVTQRRRYRLRLLLSSSANAGLAERPGVEAALGSVSRAVARSADGGGATAAFAAPVHALQRRLVSRSLTLISPRIVGIKAVNLRHRPLKQPRKPLRTRTFRQRMQAFRGQSDRFDASTINVTREGARTPEAGVSRGRGRAGFYRRLAMLSDRVGHTMCRRHTRHALPASHALPLAVSARGCE